MIIVDGDFARVTIRVAGLPTPPRENIAPWSLARTWRRRPAVSSQRFVNESTEQNTASTLESGSEHYSIGRHKQRIVHPDELDMLGGFHHRLVPRESSDDR